MSDIIVRVENVTKKYGDFTAVNGLSFEVQKAECFGLLGPNGAGKTTMMKLIYAKAENHAGGNIRVFGHDPARDALSIKQRSGVVPQEDNLDNELKVRQNLYIYSKFYGMKKDYAKKRIDELLEMMELKEKEKSPIHELSGGMKRRLVIARALLNNPGLLILDEPTTGLDPQVRHLIWDKLRFLKKQGVTILLTTHYMEEAFQICDRVMIMDKGKKVVEGHPADLLSKEMERYVLEVYYPNKLNVNNISTNDVRIDNSHEIALFYSDNMERLSTLTKGLNPGDYFLRQTNLEDLFLKTTGRKLNEKQ